MKGSTRVGWRSVPVWALVAMGSVALGESKQRPVSTAPAPNHAVNATQNELNWPIRISTERCQSCHKRESSHSHPVNFAVGRDLPAGLPMANGRLTCVTCHLEDAPSHFDQTLRDGQMLRPELAGAVDACLVCHDAGERGTAKQRRAAGHALALGSAHSGTRRMSSASSRSCLACHDGVMSGEGDVRFDGISMRMSGLRTGSSAGVGASHPVDVTYPANGRAIATSGESFQLRDPRQVDNRVDIRGGALTCASCHSLYSDQPSLLVMSNRGSALCLSCHIK